jgi:ribonuclease HI
MKPQEIPAPPETSPFPEGATAYAYADGASRGNPGAAAYGVVYTLEDGTVLCGEHASLGHTTNNVAEWRGCVAALQRLRGWGVRRVVIRLDSQLVVRQVQGQYKVKQPHLMPFHAQALKIAREFERFSIEHVPRAQNALADALANAALDA